MKTLNKYIWELYKQSPAWRTTERLFNIDNLAGNEYSIIKKYAPLDVTFIEEEFFHSMLESLYAYNVSEHEQPQTLEEAKQMYESILFFGLRIEQEEYIPMGDYNTMLGLIPTISLLCYYHATDFFFPYLFRYKAFELNKIADNFGISMPKLPKKSDFKARCMYYWDLCESLYLFRMENELSPIELCAFLYDFAPNHIKAQSQHSETPKPSQAWFIGGLINKYDIGTGVSFWQGSPETRRGDILIHYETAPISSITRLWISQTDGVIDPFFHYYANIYLGDEIVFTPITLEELRKDKYFSTHPLIRKSFQGVSGWRLTAEDYANFLRILQAKEENTLSFPQLYAPTLAQNLNIKKERDVELQLLEPLLKELGMIEGNGYTRQVPVQSGKGTSVFPDYVIDYNEEKQKCSTIIEVKHYMKSCKELSDTFNQARSYALLLEASTMILCDKNCLIIYRKKEGFDRNEGMRFYWEELRNPDKFSEIKSIIANPPQHRAR